jgi:peptidoglycan/xylan/chitin deacetylase (PgdA/CDA1 family)
MSPRDAAVLACRHAAALVLAAVGVPERRIAARRGRAVILTYHRVLPDDADVSGIEPGMYVRESTFDRQLAWLSERFDVRTLGEFVREPPAPDGDPVAVITFDDGWRDNLTHAWPTLRRHGMRATLFAVRDCIASKSGPNGEFVDPKELRRLSDDGMEIGAHTVSHPRLDVADRARALDEMIASKAAVEDWTGRPCELFAYPYGLYGQAAVEAAREQFLASVAGSGGWWRRGWDPAVLPRIGMHQDMTSSIAMFAARVTGDGG